MVSVLSIFFDVANPVCELEPMLLVRPHDPSVASPQQLVGRVIGPGPGGESGVCANVGEDYLAGAESTELPQLRRVVMAALFQSWVTTGIKGDDIGVTHILENKDLWFFYTAIISAGAGGGQVKHC